MRPEFMTMLQQRQGKRQGADMNGRPNGDPNGGSIAPAAQFGGLGLGLGGGAAMLTSQQVQPFRAISQPPTGQSPFAAQYQTMQQMPQGQGNYTNLFGNMGAQGGPFPEGLTEEDLKRQHELFTQMQAEYGSGPDRGAGRGYGRGRNSAMAAPMPPMAPMARPSTPAGPMPMAPSFAGPRGPQPY